MVRGSGMLCARDQSVWRLQYGATSDLSAKACLAQVAEGAIGCSGLDRTRPAARIFRLTRVFWNANTQEMHKRPFARRLLTNARILLVSIAIEFMAPSAG